MLTQLQFIYQNFIIGQTSQNIDATGVMWEFFSRHALPARSVTP